MKLKKLLAGLTAAALSVGLVAVSPMIASAEAKTETINVPITGAIEDWEGNTIKCEHQTTHVGEADLNQYDKAELVVDVTSLDSSITKIQFAGAAGWDWIISDSFTADELSASNTTITKTLDFTTLDEEKLNSLTQLIFRIDTTSDTLITEWGLSAKIILTQKEGAVIVPKDEWAKNDDGKWQLTRGAAASVPDLPIDFSELTQLDLADISNVTVNLSINGQGGGGIGCNDAVDGWKDAEWSGDNTTISMDFSGIEAGQKLQFKTYWANTGTVIVIDSIVITGKSTVAVTGVTLDKNAVTLKTGDTATLKATVSPDNATDKTVTWATSNAKVATVANGVVTAVGAGEATITATAGDKSAEATVTVKAAIVPVTATITPDEVTVYSAEASAQEAEVENKLAVTVAPEGGAAIASTNYTVDVKVDTAATEETPSKAVVTVALNDTGKAKYSMTDVTKEITVKYEDKVPAVYQGYDIKTALEVEADTEAEATELIEALVKEQVLTLKGADGAEDWTYGKVGANLKNIVVGAIADGTCTVTADIDMAGVRQPNDKYFSADSKITLGDSAEVSTKTEKVTFTVAVTLPKPEEPKPEEPKPEEPKPEEPKPEEPKPEEPKPEEPKPEEPKPEEPKPEEPKPEEPKPELPAAPIGNTPRVGDGVVPTDVNTGAAVTGTKAIEAAATAKPGDRIDVVMIGNDNAGEVIEKIAGKKDVVVNLRYTGYIISINSDDVADDFDAKNIYSAARFLTKAEKDAFAGAKELRQVRINSFNGIDKVTVSVIMRGGSKGQSATALNRAAAGRYQEVATGKVGADRTFSFEVTKPGNYVVYTGDVSFED